MQLEIFKYQSEEEQAFNDITTVDIEGQIWFLASDVCKALDISNVSDAVSRLDDDEKLASVLPIAGQNRNVNLINESGLYALIFKSRKQSAMQFRKWVTKEVIPSIRQKGFYGKIDRTQLPNFITRYKENYHIYTLINSCKASNKSGADAISLALDSASVLLGTKTRAIYLLSHSIFCPSIFHSPFVCFVFIILFLNDFLISYYICCIYIGVMGNRKTTPKNSPTNPHFYLEKENFSPSNSIR